MKKFLLLALSAATAITVSAGVVKESRSVAQNATAQKVAANIEDVITNESAVMVSPATAFNAKDAVQPFTVQKAEGDETTSTPIPYYLLPDGAFYNTWLIFTDNMNFNLWGYTHSKYNLVDYVPMNVPLTWYNYCGYTGEKPSTIDISWTYSTLEDAADGGVDISENTSTENNLVTPPYRPYYIGYSAPYITFNELSYGDDRLIYGGGQMEWNFGEDGYAHYGLSNLNLKNTCAQADIETDPIGLWWGNYSNWTIGKQYRYVDTVLRGIAMEIAKPEGGAVFGLNSVTFVGWINSDLTGNLNVDVYEKIFTEDPDNPGYGSFSIGERIGGGYLEGSEITSSTSTQFLTIPMIDIDGDFASQSFVNIDRDVYVILSVDEEDFGKVVARPYFMGKNGRVACYGWDLLGIYDGDDNSNYTGEDLIMRSSGPSWGFSGGANAVGYSLFFDGVYTTLDCISENGELEFVAPVEGGTKEFTFEPYFDLMESGKFTGEGVNDWLLVYADDFNEETYEQKVTIEVDPLPAGEKGRATEVIIAQPGSQVKVIVRQGDTSGIDTIEGDNANVVSSQIFDLQGRQLNAVPENGLYIRRDVKADNTITTTKVVK